MPVVVVDEGVKDDWRAPLGGYCMGYMDMNVGMKLVLVRVLGGCECDCR